MCAVPVTVAVLATSPFGNGWNSFIGGSIAAISGPPAYFVFKRVYKGMPLPAIGYEYADDELSPRGGRRRVDAGSRRPRRRAGAGRTVARRASSSARGPAGWPPTARRTR